jgi:hypothetical protein
MFRRLFLFPIAVTFFVGNAVIDRGNNPPRLTTDETIVQSPGQSVNANAPSVQIDAPDLKMHIDGFTSPNLGPSCLGYPIKVGYITVTNVGKVACRGPKLATSFGYFPVAGPAVLFQVTSVGPKPLKLAPGASFHMVLQNATCNGQKAIDQGYVEVNEPACRGETNKANNKATRVEGITYNPN